MRKTYIHHKQYLALCISLFFYGSIAMAQIGIATDTPNGILDIESSTQGVVLPVVSLEDRYQEDPVVNPSGSTSLAIGTVVYNTNNTSNGSISGTSDDVAPGIYVWDGNQWQSQFTRKQYQLFEQSVLNIRTQSNEGARTINGVNGQFFTAEHTGIYRIEVNVNFGGGQAKTPQNGGPPSSRSEGELNIAQMSGDFVVSVNGISKTITASAFSSTYSGANGNGNNSTDPIYWGIWKQYTIVYYQTFTTNDVVPITLTFDQNDAFAFLGEGNNNHSDGSFTGGDGHVGFDTPCTVEISYIGN